MGSASLLWAGEIRQNRGRGQTPTPSTTGKLRQTRRFAFLCSFCIQTRVSGGIQSFLAMAQAAEPLRVQTCLMQVKYQQDTNQPQLLNKCTGERQPGPQPVTRELMLPMPSASPHGVPRLEQGAALDGFSWQIHASTRTSTSISEGVIPGQKHRSSQYPCTSAFYP